MVSIEPMRKAPLTWPGGKLPGLQHGCQHLSCDCSIYRADSSSVRPAVESEHCQGFRMSKFGNRLLRPRARIWAVTTGLHGVQTGLRRQLPLSQTAEHAWGFGLHIRLQYLKLRCKSSF